MIVGIERGVKSKETILQIRHWTEKIGAIVAGSRTTVENGLIDACMQVRQTGHSLAPDLYIARINPARGRYHRSENNYSDHPRPFRLDFQRNRLWLGDSRRRSLTFINSYGFRRENIKHGRILTLFESMTRL